MATNTAAELTSPAPSRFSINGVIILNTTAINSPTAAQATPASVRRNASISP